MADFYLPKSVPFIGALKGLHEDKQYIATSTRAHRVILNYTFNRSSP